MAKTPVHILVASNNPVVIAESEPVLRAAGYAVSLVSTGPDVLHYTGDAAPDLYLLDNDLPQMNGLRVARHLRQSYEVPRERIILIYPADQPPSYQAEIQAQDLLISPFTGVELILSVMRHLQQATEP